MREKKAKDPKKLTKIAVIDDSKLTRQKIIESLEKNGFQVVGEAESAEKAMKIVAEGEANLYIVDVVLPGVNGIELVRKIHDKIRAYVIMISSLKQDHIIIECISAGALDYLYKPIREQDLINSVEKIADVIAEDTVIF